MNKMIVQSVFLLLLAGAVLASPDRGLRPPVLEEMEMVKEKSSHVEILTHNGLYYTFHKRIDGSLLSELFSLIEYERMERNQRGTCGGEGQYLRFVFYDKEEEVSWMVLTPNGQIETEKRWCAYLTSESQLKLNRFLSKLGYTDDLGPLPISSNVSAETNAVFRKGSSVPYVLNNAVFVMPNENFSVGVVVHNFNIGGYIPDNYSICYLDDQRYDATMDVAFHVDKGTQKGKQARIDIKNNCSFAVVLSLFAVKEEELCLISNTYEVLSGNTLSIKADPTIKCYILACIKDKPDD